MSELADFTERVAAYMETRTAPWADVAVMREAVAEAIRLCASEAWDEFRDIVTARWA